MKFKNFKKLYSVKNEGNSSRQEHRIFIFRLNMKISRRIFLSLNCRFITFLVIKKLKVMYDVFELFTIDNLFFQKIKYEYRKLIPLNLLMKTLTISTVLNIVKDNYCSCKQKK